MKIELEKINNFFRKFGLVLIVKIDKLGTKNTEFILTTWKKYNEQINN